MITMDFRGDMSVALRSVDQISDAVKGRATARALNRAATTVRASARKEVRARYNLTAGRVNKVIQIRQASASKPEAVVYARDQRLALAVFGSRQQKRSGNVTVQVLRGGPRKIVKGNPKYRARPFVQTVGKGRHVGIFQREGAARLPIQELFSVSIPGGLVNKTIGRILQQVAAKRFNEEFRRELAFRAGRGR